MTDQPQQPDTGQLRSFTALLGAVEDGQFHADLTDALREIVAELQDSFRDQGGKPKARLDLSFDFRLDGGVIEVNCDLKVKKPRAQRSKSVFWSTPDNLLTRRNPKQQELPLRHVPPVSAPAHTVA